ncbi:MAG: hypothetical protein HQK54_17150, partial [Oligoflexales bacterium]|nr:hypothetical protein [Oligoflexales bacterium]
MNLNFQFVEPFASNPGFLEKIEIAKTNIPTIFLVILAGWFILKIKDVQKKSIILFIYIATLAVIPTIYRWLGGYPYDTPFALMSWFSDLIVLLFIMHGTGAIFLNRFSGFIKISVGLAIWVLLGVSLTYFDLQKLLGQPKVGISILTAGIFEGLFVFYIYKLIFRGSIEKHRLFVRENLPICLLATFVFIVPILPYLFTPAPPDSDITVMSEFVGFLFQGQSFDHFASGIPGEYYSIRYPWGVPALAWGLGHVFLQGAS